MIVAKSHLNVNGYQMYVKILIVQQKIKLEIVIKNGCAFRAANKCEKKTFCANYNMIEQLVVLILDVMLELKELIIYILVKTLQFQQLLQRIVELLQLMLIALLHFVNGVRNVVHKRFIKLKSMYKYLRKGYNNRTLFVWDSTKSLCSEATTGLTKI